MQRLFSAIVARRWLAIVLSLIVLAGGIWNMQHLAIDAVPDISPKQVMILTQANGLGPLEVERLVTAPIEMQMTGLPGLAGVRSKSSFGLSAVYVTLDDAVDVDTARARIFERLQAAQATMPPGVGTPEEGPLTTGLGEILEFELRGPGYTQMQLYQLLKWKIVPQLRLVPGIVNVNIYGGDLQTYEIAVDPQKLRARSVSLPELFSAIESNNAARGGAYIEHGDEQQVVRGMAMVQSRADIASIVVRATPGGIPITGGDHGAVRLAPQVRLGAVTHDGAGETVVGVASMEYGLNASQVLPKLKAGLDSVRKTLPPGVAIDVFYDRSDLVGRAVDTIAHNLVEGALFVIVILLLLLGNLRAGLIVAAVIPIAMMIAFVGMRVLGIPANLMSLGAIDFGLVVDGAVVLVENVLRRQTDAGNDAAGKELDSVASMVPKAAAEVARPVTFSVAIILAVYLPVLSLQSIEGKMFRPMALTVMLALTGALVVTMLLLPALAATFLSDRPQTGDTLVVRAARRVYTPALRWSTARPWTVFGAAAIAFVISAFLGTRLGGEFIPQLQEGAIVVTSNKLPSIDLSASLRTVTEIEKVIRSVPEVRTVVSQTGSAAVPTDPMGVESTDSYAILTPPGQWHGRTQDDIKADLESKLSKAIPGVQFEFSQPIEMRMDDLLQGVRSPVALTIYGDDLATLRRLADQAVGIVGGIKGASDVAAEQQGGLPDLTVTLDRAALARSGVPAAEILSLVESIGGRVVGTVYGSDDSQTPIVVRLAAESRTSAAQIGTLPVALADGGTVQLSSLATIAVAEGPAQIQRETLRRRIAVKIDVEGRSMNGFVTEAQKTIAAKLHLPEGYTLDWSGEFQNLRSASARLSLVVPAVLGLVYLMLYLNFGSLRLAGLIFLNVPMAATGGILALLLRGMPFSVSAGIGFISTFGIAILDGVVLVSYIQEERARGLAPTEAARSAAEKRLRPVLTTALVASIGFVPMALATSTGSEVQRPLATVVIGGLITATMLTLLVLPSLYPRLMRDRRPGRASAPPSP